MKPAVAQSLNPISAGADCPPVAPAGTPSGASPWAALAKDRFSVVSVTDFAALADIGGAWADLAARSLEPNPFYELWMLGPALAHLRDGADLRVVLVFAPNPARPAEPLLCGVFPLERRPRHKGIPSRTLRLWRHKFCQLGTPLIRASHARETLEAFFTWLAGADHACALLELNHVTGEGPFHHLLVDYLDQHAILHHVGDCFARAIFRPAGDASAYVNGALSTKHRKALARHEQQLRQAGRLEYVALDAGGSPTAWLDEFLALEASGWKGRERSALDSSPADREFFVSSATAAFRLGRLRMLALRLDGRMIAARCGFSAGYAGGRGAYTFKVAYDERYARLSPGLLLEIENIRRLHDDETCDWMDSFTSRDHPVFNRLWRDRILMRDCVIGTGGRRGDLIVSLLGLMRWLKRKTRTASPTASARPETHAEGLN